MEQVHTKHRKTFTREACHTFTCSRTFTLRNHMHSMYITQLTRQMVTSVHCVLMSHQCVMQSLHHPQLPHDITTGTGYVIGFPTGSKTLVVVTNAFDCTLLYRSKTKFSKSTFNPVCNSHVLFTLNPVYTTSTIQIHVQTDDPIHLLP